MSPPSLMSLSLEEFQPDMAIMESPILKFPVSPGCFHPTGSKRQAYLDLIRQYVSAILLEEEQITARRDQLLPPFDPTKWKQVKMSKELRFFKRIRGDQTLEDLANEETLAEMRQAVQNGYSTILCTGQVQGSIEDMMFGMTASSQEDLMTGFWYKNPPRDCVWLGTADGPTPEDPFRSADFIWAFPKVAYHTDICYLKATGVETDENGNMYGYLVLHSVELPHCRPFEARKISRAKMYFACLFREIVPGYLNVLVRGIFNLGKRRGTIAKKFVTAATKSVMIGLLNGIGIGLAKKLTIMARRNRHILEERKQIRCSNCLKTKRRTLFGLGLHLVQCGVCGATICSNCLATTKQILFLGHEAPCSKHACCLTCMREARRSCGVRPQEPDFQVIADYFLHKPRSRSALRPNSPLSSPLLPTYPLDTKTQSGRPQFSMKSTTSAGIPTMSTANESLDTDPFSRELDEADFCFSDGETHTSILVQPDPSPNMSDESDHSTLTVWRMRHYTEEDDFIPATKGRTRPEFEVYHNALFQLNIAAENTYMQTQATARRLREAELD